MAISSTKDAVSAFLEAFALTPRHFAALSAVEQELAPLGRGVQVVGFKQNRIYVEAESPVQLAELSFRKREILKRLRSTLKGQAADPEIKFFLRGAARTTKKESLQGAPVRRFARATARYGG